MKTILFHLFSVSLCFTAAVYAQEAMPGEAPALAVSNDDIVVPGESDTVDPASPEPTKLDLLVRADVIIEKIRTNSRRMDPFGMSMDPTNMVENSGLAEQYQDLEETPVISNSALKMALQTLPITGIYPTKHTIVLGARSFRAGDVFGMKLEELTIRLRLEGVKGNSVYFKDLDTQEVATVEFNTRPAEFEPITSNSSQPMGKGIVPMNELYIVN